MSLSELLKRQYLLIRNELKSKTPVPVGQRYRMLLKGFYRESNVIYDLKNNNYVNYLSDYDRHKTRGINGEYGIILKNKLLFEVAFKESLPIAKNIAVINERKIISIGSNNVNSFSDLLEYLEEKKAMVLKPITGTGGAGIFVVKWNNGITLNEKQISLDEFDKKVNELKNYFVNEYIEQGDYSRSLNGNTLNTIRIVTMQDVDSGEPFIPIAVQRIGNKTSSPTDNWTQGGLSCNINLNTGELGKGVVHPKNRNELTWYKNHPDNGAKIEGKIIPNWEYIKSEILRAAREKPFLPYIGWDVVVTNDGFRVIEGNSMTDVNLLQVHKPLLVDNRVQKFYEFYGII